MIHHCRANCFSKLLKKKLANGELCPETLAWILSLSEEAKQKAYEPEPSRQLGLTLDTPCTIQSRRIHLIVAGNNRTVAQHIPGDDPCVASCPSGLGSGRRQKGGR